MTNLAPTIDTQEIDLSVIVPLYNEEENVALMHEAVVNATRDLGRTVEIVFVDDGSKDKTLEIAKTLPRQVGPVLLRIVRIPPQLRADGRDGRRHRACARAHPDHYGRRSAE